MLEPERAELQKSERDFFSDIYAEQQYSVHAWEFRYRRDLNRITRHVALTGTEQVLSLGCGDGGFELMLAPHVGHILGLDLSPEAIKLAALNAEASGIANVSFLCKPITEMDWGVKFEAIISLAFLHHVPEGELPDLLHTVYLQLNPGGWFYAQDPNIHGILRRLGRVVLGRRYDRFHTPDERELDPGALKNAVRSAGFHEVYVGCIDFTLIPSSFIFPKGPRWYFALCSVLDRVLCKTPLASGCSGFYLLARKQKEGG